MYKLKPFIILLFYGCLLTALTLQAQKVTIMSGTSLNFDADWRFMKGDFPDAENPTFDDSHWRKLDVPHDWSIEGLYDKENLTSRGGGYLSAGIGWYRKSFLDSEVDYNNS